MEQTRYRKTSVTKYPPTPRSIPEQQRPYIPRRKPEISHSYLDVLEEVLLFRNTEVDFHVQKIRHLNLCWFSRVDMRLMGKDI